MPLTHTRAALLGTNQVVAVTWNPADTDASITFTNSNLTATATATGDRGARGTTGKTTGKWYFECLTGATWTGGDTGCGFLKAGASFANYGAGGTLGIGIYTGTSIFNGSSQGVHGLGSTGAGVVLGWAVDLDANLAWATKDGVTWSYSGNPATGTNGKAGGWTTGNTVHPAFVHGGNGNIINGRFHNAQFTLTKPTGFQSWGG